MYNISSDIKFRVWDGEKFCFTTNDIHIYPRGFSDNFGLSFAIKPNKRVKDHPTDASEKIKLCVQQFTGLKDKNGKEIYEGDIVEFPYLNRETSNLWINLPFLLFSENGLNAEPNLCEENIQHQMWKYKREIVVWNEYGYYPFLISRCGYLLYSYHCKIIGNIFENPELLK